MVALALQSSSVLASGLMQARRRTAVTPVRTPLALGCISRGRLVVRAELDTPNDATPPKTAPYSSSPYTSSTGIPEVPRTTTNKPIQATGPQLGQGAGFPPIDRTGGSGGNSGRGGSGGSGSQPPEESSWDFAKIAWFVVGLGAAYWVFNYAKDNIFEPRHTGQKIKDETRGIAHDTKSSVAHDAKSAARDVKGAAADAKHHTVDPVRGAVSNAVHKAGDVVHNVEHRVENAASAVKHSAQLTGLKAEQAFERTKDSVGDAIHGAQENIRHTGRSLGESAKHGGTLAAENARHNVKQGGENARHATEDKKEGVFAGVRNTFRNVGQALHLTGKKAEVASDRVHLPKVYVETESHADRKAQIITASGIAVGASLVLAAWYWERKTGDLSRNFKKVTGQNKPPSAKPPSSSTAASSAPPPPAPKPSSTPAVKP